MNDYSNYYPSYDEILKHNGDEIFLQQQEQEGEEVVIIGGNPVDSVNTKAIIHDYSSALNEDREDRKIFVLNKDEIKRGFYVKTVDDNRTFLIVTKVKRNISYQTAKMIECSNSLKWQDKDLIIHEVDGILVDKTSVYSDGIAKTKYITLADDQLMMTVQNNEVTRKIATGQRFIFNHDKEYVYKVTKIDRLTQDGIIDFVMTHDQFNNATDNVELGIAAYQKPKEEPVEPETPIEPPTEDNYIIEILGEEKISFGTIQTYTAIVKNNGIEDVSQTVTFSLENIIRATPVINSVDGNQVSITNKTTSAGTFVLKATLDSDNTVFVERKLKINI